MDIASPMVDNTTVRSVLTNMPTLVWDNDDLDITTAFLHGKMKEDVYMKCPEGIEWIEDDWDREEDCTRLLQTFYGTKQAARQYWKWRQCRRKGFKALIQTVVICVCVDDCLLTGDRQAIDAAILDIEEKLEIMRLGPVKEYVGCSIIGFPMDRRNCYSQT
jgi:hypothetical protein